MSRFEGGHDWHLASEHSGMPEDSGDDTYWQQRLEDEYVVEVSPAQRAVWMRAVMCLAAYGGERCFKTGPLGSRENPALSTGLLLLGEPVAYKDGSAMNAVRVSTADPYLQARDLPLRAIKRAGKRATDEAIDIAAGALDSVAAFNSIYIEALMLATTKTLLSNENFTRGKVREAVMPAGYRGRIHWGEPSSFMRDASMREVLRRRPEVALWGSSLECFDSRNYAYIQRPEVPQLTPPDDRSFEGWHRAMADALKSAHDRQPHAETVLDMLMHVTMPVRRALGKRAVVPLVDD